MQLHLQEQGAPTCGVDGRHHIVAEVAPQPRTLLQGTPSSHSTAAAAAAATGAASLLLPLPARPPRLRLRLLRALRGSRRGQRRRAVSHDHEPVKPQRRVDCQLAGGSCQEGGQPAALPGVCEKKHHIVCCH